ncbi:tail protein X [Escherichia coli]|uniref:tail protein X n=1 Tax=Escherichia coli TaxID=562 RepID=UPI003860248E
MSREGDTVDELCLQHYGTTRRVTEQVYTANPGLCEKGPRLPAGLQIWLPDIPAVATADVVQLWD